MKIAWSLLTLLLVGSLFYLNRPQASAPAGNQSSDSRQSSTSDHRLAQSMQAKLDHIRANSEREHPDQTPTVLTEEEINDYLASNHVQLPQGVKKVRLEGRSGVVDAFVNVDFDEIRGGQRSANPLLSLFSGRHDVRLQADAAGSGGQGKVHVRRVSIDGIDVPQIALQYFVEKYITPKYPNVGIDSTFQMPNKIDVATVNYHKLTLTQK
jgi:hypothetical protein